MAVKGESAEAGRLGSPITSVLRCRPGPVAVRQN